MDVRHFRQIGNFARKRSSSPLPIIVTSVTLPPLDVLIPNHSLTCLSCPSSSSESSTVFPLVDRYSAESADRSNGCAAVGLGVGSGSVHGRNCCWTDPLSLETPPRWSRIPDAGLEPPRAAHPLLFQLSRRLGRRQSIVNWDACWDAGTHPGDAPWDAPIRIGCGCGCQRAQPKLSSKKPDPPRIRL